jgi:hypothetical protein
MEAGTRSLSVEFLPWNENYTTAIKTVTVEVLQPSGGLTFNGFYVPVLNMPAWNQVKAGGGIRVKFSVTGDQAANALAGPLTSRSVSCEASATAKAAPGMRKVVRTLKKTQDGRTGEYSLTWNTNSSWAGTCRVLEVRLVDGSVYEAQFQFQVHRGKGGRDVRASFERRGKKNKAK